MNNANNNTPQSKYQRWAKLKGLGFNYNFRQVSDKTLKQKLNELYK
tara:strand:- start:724 stop:861 length:138 start_codon:yes stop_codon:yes gene_type:complete